MWGAPIRLSVTALPGHRIKAGGKFTIWDTELMHGGSLAPGTIGGRVLHPDTPDKDQRGAHQDHIHANLGHNGPGKKNFDMWLLVSKSERQRANSDREYER